MHLIRRSVRSTVIDKLQEALNTVHGGFAYLIMTENEMIGALDPNGFRPLSLGRMSTGAYVLASETCALDVVGAERIRDIQPGEMIVINDEGYRIITYTSNTHLSICSMEFIYFARPDSDIYGVNVHSARKRMGGRLDEGYRIITYTSNTQLSICSMEFIYFARPDSDIYGVNVHSARKRMGARLAQEAPVDADMVIGVPNSSLSAASGYAEESGLPNEMGLIKNQYVARTFIQPTQALREQGVRMKLSAVKSKNQYVARTFIQPTQALREQGVRMKLSAVKSVVKGKRIIVIDDSIVRGTTSRRIVQILKEAGAAEVHMRISSPPLKYPCFYGIDISTTQELIAAKKSVEEIREFIGADSLAFLSVDGLMSRSACTPTPRTAACASRTSTATTPPRSTITSRTSSIRSPPTTWCACRATTTRRRCTRAPNTRTK